MSRRVTTSLLAALLACLVAAASAAGARPHLRVRYLGSSVSVPRSWPVIDLVRHPGTCVRFDRHAVYLGHPAAHQACPGSAIGRTEALLLQPARGARVAAPGVTFRRGGALITATWRRDPAAIRAALGLRRLPAPAAVTAAAAPARAARPLARSAGVTTGLGFDVCATPSEATLRAWGSSPYRTVGIYLGGQNMACSQPNLTAQWVSDEAAAGWHFIPTYVGLQAPGTSCGCSTISSGQAAAQGQSAGTDAIARARAVGIGSGNPIYFDMEGYGTGGGATQTALTFLSAWTSALHAAGYRSGVYSSAASGISDLVAAYGGTQYVSPDDIWIADWNGTHSTADSYVPSSDWAAHQRLHQYSGGVNATYGGVTLNIDGDYLDGATAGGAAVPDGTFVTVAGSTAFYRIVGGAPLPVTDWWPFGGPQPAQTLSAAQFAALSPTPADGSLAEGLPSNSFWRFVAGRRLAIPAASGATPVQDAALSAFPLAPPPVRCVVPKLHRLSLSGASSALRGAHCTVGVVHVPRHVRRGHALRVHAQRPSPGSLRPKGHNVNLALL